MVVAELQISGNRLMSDVHEDVSAFWGFGARVIVASFFFFPFFLFCSFPCIFPIFIFFFGKMGDVRRTEGKETVMVNGKKES